MVVKNLVPVHSDETLLDDLILTHSHAAFSELVRRHALKFRHLAFRFTGTRQDAEDIVQDAFLRLWNRPEMWDGKRGVKFTTWFYRIVTNLCLDHVRRHKNVTVMPEEMEDTDALPDSVLEERQKMVAVENAFRAMPRQMQAALNLSFYEGIPNRESAEIMGMSLKGFQSLLMRAKKTLKDKITETDYRNNYMKAGQYEIR